MPHGAPDWADIAPRKTVYGAIDLAELAARLGSIVSFDRRGDVIFLEDFEGRLGRWYTGSSDDEGYVRLTYGITRSGFGACRLYAPATDGEWVYMYTNLPEPVPSKLGLEFSFSGWYMQGIFQWEISLRNAGGFGRFYRGRITSDGDKVQIYNVDTWEDIATRTDLFPGEQQYYPIKMVIDVENHKYVRLIVGGESYDISAYSPRELSPPDVVYLHILFERYADGSVFRMSHIDDVILTQNEP